MESQNKLAFFDNFNKYYFFSEESDFFIDELHQKKELIILSKIDIMIII